MEEKENYGFCPSCGANVSEGASFCPECGRSLGGQPEEDVRVGGSPGYRGPSPQQRLQGKAMVAFIFVLLYGVLTILGALSLFTITEATLEQSEEALKMVGYDSFDDFLSSMGINMTKSEFVDMCHIAAVVDLISGALAVAGAVLTAKHTKRILATVLVVAASLINFALVTFNGVFSTILSVAVGCIMAYLIYSSPESFRD